MGSQPRASGYPDGQSFPQPPQPLHPDSSQLPAPYDTHRASHYGEPARHGEAVDRFPIRPQVPISQHYRSFSGGDGPYRRPSSREVTYVNEDVHNSPMGAWEPDGPTGAQITSLARDDDALARVPRARTLGGDRYERNPIVIREIRSITLPMDVDAQGDAIASGARIRLPIPPLRSLVSTKIEEREGDVFEGRNSEDSSGALDLA